MENGVRKPDGTMVPWYEVPEEELAKMIERVSGDGPGDVSPEEMVDGFIDEEGEDIEHILQSELNRAIENNDDFEIGFWKATLGYLARRSGNHIRAL